tara:strand:+ start:3125 stop:3460 length:336 start_codon:yes stop_codon:yes gene_type:complete
MLKNKIILSAFILFFIFSCTSDFSYEGRIISIDTTLSNGLKSVSSITLISDKNEQKIFYTLSEKKLEDINIEFTYSHIKSHMEEGKQVKIKHEELNNKFYILDFRFSDHNH